MNAAPAQERALVEVVVALGRGDLAEDLELGTLRRRAAGRQLELHRLGDHSPAEAQHTCCDTSLVLPATGGTGHDDQRVAAGADVAEQDAAIERVEPRAPPPPPGERQGDDEQPQPRPRLRHKTERRNCEDSEPNNEDARSANRSREREPADQRSREHVRPPTHEQARHGATSSVSCSSRAGPIPGIASSSRTELNAPCFSR